MVFTPTYKNEMEKEFEEIVKRVSVGGLIGLMAATIRFLLKSGESIWTKTKIFLAGVFLALLLSMILVYSNVSTFWQNILCGAGAAFVSTIWPVIEKGVVDLIKIFFKKKQQDIDNVVDFNRNKYTGGPGRPSDPSEHP